MSVLSIFPVVKHLRSIKPEFDYTLEVWSLLVYGPLTSQIGYDNTNKLTEYK
jgi:hypothetical protein